jgi:hypothetical protein
MDDLADDPRHPAAERAGGAMEAWKRGLANGFENPTPLQPSSSTCATAGRSPTIC